METPKPYIRIAGKPILEHTLLAFSKMKEIEQVIVSTSEAYIKVTGEILDSVFPNENTRVVIGGTERQDSIRNALQFIDDQIDLIGVHDAVRPFVSAEDIKECLQVARQSGGAVMGVPAKDTIKRVDADLQILETPSRKSLWQAQTPQFFQKPLLLNAYQYAQEHGFVGTDDASLVEKIGGSVVMVEGRRENFKITYPIDLQLAELLLKSLYK